MKQVGCPYHTQNSSLTKVEYNSLQGSIQGLFSDGPFVACMKKFFVECKRLSIDDHLEDNLQLLKSHVNEGLLQYFKIADPRDIINAPDDDIAKQDVSGLNTALNVVISLYFIATELGVLPLNIRDSIQKIVIDSATLSLSGLGKFRSQVGRDDPDLLRDSDKFYLKDDGMIDCKDSFNFDVYPGQCPALTASVIIDGKKTTPIKWMLDQICGVSSTSQQEIGEIFSNG